ncbi:hypothetical protein K2173_023292 [Erythroxylum novogranatense]|uniref:Mitochondrial protein n=1 Tax=Erythroxylum novogranatense TaxID=1862640 RepID=A0AAV8T8G5_9ROSI|nr:hypothetical protein K2173_023292 [Erythroxylum novogranatense]
MTDLGEMSYFLGMEVQQSQDGIFIGQQKYAKKVLKKFKTDLCKPMSTPLMQNEKLSKDDGATKVDEGWYQSLIGYSMYLTATTPNLMFVVFLLSKFMHCASELHFKATKRVLRYIKGTENFGIMFKKSTNLKLVGYFYSDHAGSCDDMRNTSGYVFSLGSGCFPWSSKKQDDVAQSTVEAEYVAAAGGVNQAL